MATANRYERNDAGLMSALFLVQANSVSEVSSAASSGSLTLLRKNRDRMPT